VVKLCPDSWRTALQEITEGEQQREKKADSNTGVGFWGIHEIVILSSKHVGLLNPHVASHKLKEKEWVLISLMRWFLSV
jgi:hypothetical protein